MRNYAGHYFVSFNPEGGTMHPASSYHGAGSIALASRRLVSARAKQVGRSWVEWIACFISLLMLGFLARVGAAAAALFILPWLLLAARSPRLAAAKLAQNAPFFILPALAVLSVTWSQYPEATLRLSIQFLLTSIIGIWAGTLIHPVTFASALLCALTAIVTGGIAADGGASFRGEQALQGFFDSKNMFALFTVIQLIAGITVLLDRRQSLFVRALGLFSLFEAPVCLVAAQSTGALVFSIPAIAAFLAIAAIARLPEAVRQVLVAVAIIAGAAALILIISFGGDTDLLLESLGKDSTLTGRTYLWQRARDFIDQAPLLGTGYAAFWQIGNPPAEELWAASFEESGAGFNFHNLYLNTAVELGYVGLTSLITMLLTASVRLLISIVKRPSPPVYFATAVFTFFCLTSFIEVALLYQFHLGTVLFGAIWAYSGNQALSTYGSALTPRKRMAMPTCIKPRRNHRRQADVNPAMPAATAAQAPALAAERHALPGETPAPAVAKTISA
jgi:exopolysaccharide production protein ExoQ